MYFHALFWPAILMGSGFRTPTAVFAHGFLTIQGEKMSKSRGTFITAENYLKHLNPEYLRYYFAAKLNQQIEDIDLNFEDREFNLFSITTSTRKMEMPFADYDIVKCVNIK